MTFVNKLLKGSIWILGVSGLPLGVFLAFQVYWFIHSGFLAVVTFFGILVGMAMLAGEIDKKFKIGFMLTLSQSGKLEDEK